MAFNLLKMLGLQAKRPDVKIGPFTSLREIPEIQTYLQTLQERLAGRGIGFRPEMISDITAPFATSQRVGLKEQTIPAISAQASARGLGRSSIPISQIARESAGVERDISSRIAELSLANEQQRRNEINAALAGLGQFGQAEATQRGQAATFGQGLEAVKQAQTQQNIANLMGLGELAISGGTLFGKLAGIGGFAPASLFGESPITGTKTTTGPKVNIAGMDLDEEDILALRALLSGRQ